MQQVKEYETKCPVCQEEEAFKGILGDGPFCGRCGAISTITKEVECLDVNQIKISVESI
jgi:uncharacterized protein (DUF983 family)